MKLLFAFAISIISAACFAQNSETASSTGPIEIPNIIKNDIINEINEVFLFKHSADYFAIKCDKSNSDCSCREKKYRHCSFNKTKCKMTIMKEKLNKTVFASKLK